MYCIGFDIGGTKCAVSLGALKENEIKVLEREEVSTSSPLKTMEQLSKYVEQFKQEKEVVSAGISCGGPLDTEKGIILTPPNLPGWHGFAIVEYIQKRFGLKATLENDANACAVAEWKYGAGRGATNMVFFAFGSGLCVGMLLNE